MMKSHTVIYNIGIDLVEIERFKNWHLYSDKQLLKIFSPAEIAYCRAIPIKSAERFAVRFAAKEALFKALAPYATQPPPLRTLFAAVEVTIDHSGVHMRISWNLLYTYYSNIKTKNMAIQSSLSHTKSTAGAVVMLYFS